MYKQVGVIRESHMLAVAAESCLGAQRSAFDVQVPRCAGTPD